MPPNIKVNTRISSTSIRNNNNDPPVMNKPPPPVMSEKAKRTINPIREIVDPIVTSIMSRSPAAKTRNIINLSLGDPTAAGHLLPPKVLLEAVATSAVSSESRSYVPAIGCPKARSAIAQHYSTKEAIPLTEDDVIIASGCSGALELALTALLNPGDCILCPRPSFPLYEVICQSHGASVLHYHLLPEKNWECDIAHMESIIDQNVRGIIINNPSNPCGSVFSRQHLLDIIHFAHRHNLPIIADEVYGELAFCNFHSFASVLKDLRSSCQVPVISVSGMSKQFLVPGWRLGWMVFYDTLDNRLSNVRMGIKKLAQVTLGSSNIVQGTLPLIFASSSEEAADVLVSWKENVNKELYQAAKYTHDQLKSCLGLKPIQAFGAMYIMVHLDPLVFSHMDDQSFCRKLLEEENLFLLPGSAFGAPRYVRVVFCVPIDTLKEAITRLKRFCEKHATVSSIQ